MKALGLFLAATMAIVVLGGWILGFVWPDAAAAHAVRVSAGVAVLVQLLAFGILRLAGRQNAIAAWGLGALLRFVVLGLYAMVLVKAFALAGTPAIVSLALFFFLSTLVEPLLLNV